MTRSSDSPVTSWRTVRWLFLLLALALIFAWNLAWDLGGAEAILYLPLIGWASWLRRRVAIHALAAACAALLLLDLLAWPDQEITSGTLVEALLGVAGIGATAVLSAALAGAEQLQQDRDANYRARMAALVDSSYDAIIGKDESGRITSWNAGAERVYGYAEEEAVGQTVGLILPPDMEAEEDEIRDALRTGQRIGQFETVRRHKDGRLIPIAMSVSPIVNERGRVIGSSTVERDITDRKRDEATLRRAKDAAEEAVRVRAEFLANVSHELRTPMNSIIGMTQLALQEELTPELRDYLETASESAHSLLTLLNDILDFSKVEAGKFSIEEEPFSLRDLLDDTLKTLSMRAFERGLELACDVDPVAPDNLLGDAVRLRQILTNLVSNAVKFTEQGEVVVSVRALRKWPRETRLRFSVRDTGVGIPEEDQQWILKPFTQVDASATRRHGGTGLGLAICSELLRLMGGRLKVVSEVGKGSCFSFDLSLARQSAAEDQTPEGTPIERLRQLPVLVVDDNETNRRILTKSLENWSMQPEEARDGEEALGKFDRSRAEGAPYPVVIVDALMPGMDGYTLSKKIVQRCPDPPPVILMVSSSDRQEFRDRESEVDVAVFLQKPVSQSDLMDALMRALNVSSLEELAEVQAVARPRLGRSLSVLLAEDTPANQKVVTTLLKKNGHAVTVARNGREAVELWHQQDFDVVLMDVQMPTMDGLQATAAIREHEQDCESSTPIIAMTAHAMRGDREMCLEAGMDAYIAKPIDMNQLMKLIGSLAENAERRANAAGPSAEMSSPRSNPSSDASDEPVIDLDGALRRLAGDMDLFREFVGFFDEDSPRLLATLRQSLAERDAASARRAAHSLKGLAANFGATACVAAASDLEERAKSGDMQGADPLLAHFERELARLDEALRPHRG